MTDDERNAYYVLEDLRNHGVFPERISRGAEGQISIYVVGTETFGGGAYVLRAGLVCEDGDITLTLTDFDRDGPPDVREVCSAYCRGDAVKDALRHVGMRVD